MLYFAYGSNMDREQMRQRCPGAVLLGPAVLEGYRLVFGGHSDRWGGAVATVEIGDGSKVEGLVYYVTPNDLKSLDAFEGHPHVYQRQVMTVTCCFGGEVYDREVYVYMMPVLEELREPSSSYRKVLAVAYRCWGFNLNALRSNAEPKLRLVFVYGTLLRGERNHGLLSGSSSLGRRQTAPEFTLYDLGSYPGAAEGGETAIKGELYQVDQHTLARLDRLEGHPRFYRRRTVTLASGEKVLMYLMTKSMRTVVRIPLASGSWRDR